jgi:hypothetical protein
VHLLIKHKIHVPAIGNYLSHNNGSPYFMLLSN